MLRLLLATLSLALLPCYADKKPLWQPKVGDEWHYQVTVTVQEGTDLPKAIPGQKIEKLDGKVRATHTQKTVYRGLQPMGEAKEGEEQPDVAHTFTLSNGNALMETHFMAIKDDTIDALGVQLAGKDAKPLSTAIPLVSADWKGGEFFSFKLDMAEGEKNVRMVRKCKVIGWENLETKAGKFRALHVQASGLNGAVEIKRSYWFAPGTGFVKEVKKYYVGESVVLNQVRVLEKLVK